MSANQTPTNPEAEGKERDEIAEEMIAIEKIAFNMFSNFNNVSMWTTWAKKTAVQAQTELSKIQAQVTGRLQEKRKKGGDFAGVG